MCNTCAYIHTNFSDQGPLDWTRFDLVIDKFSFSPQLLFGFVSFLFPKLPDGLRAVYLKIHVFFGVFIFMLAIGTCLMGITEKLFFLKPPYVPNTICY